jgi:phage repressor protein C with HTH and peptisase S24 domain
VLTLAERLQLALSRIEGARPADLARACGVKKPSVSEWLSGATKTLRSDSFRKAAVFLRCRREWLETGIGDPGWTDTQHPLVGARSGGEIAHDLSQSKLNTGLIVKSQVPVIGTLTVGADDMFELRSSPGGQPIGHVPAFADQSNFYAVRVFGDELYPAVRHGACLVVDPAGAPVQGELVLMESTDGYYLVCELVADRGDTITVLPANGGQRKTFDRARFAAVHPVVDIAAASRFTPRTEGPPHGLERTAEQP